MKRIFLFIITNLAILLVLSITLRILRRGSHSDAEGNGYISILCLSWRE